MERVYRGSPLNRGRLDVTKKVLDPVGDHIDDRPITHELMRSSSSKKSNGTPMKMLIDQELLNEMESKQRPPSVVARLMGLDGLPAQQPVSTLQKSSPECYLCNASAKQGSLPRHRLQENGFLQNHHHSQSYAHVQPGYKDVYKLWQQSTKTGLVKDQPRQKGKHRESVREKKMVLVRQKFIEAKRLATDEKLRQSKEFQDALEVLSSNRDIFLEFLQEPNSLFTKHLYELQSIPPPPQTKRMTVLKPSKTVEVDRRIGPEKKFEKEIKKQCQPFQFNEWENNKPCLSSVFAHQKADNFSQPTRIVVLKPSPGKIHGIKAVVSSPTSSPRLREGTDCYEKSGTDALEGSREIAKEITQQMWESLRSKRRDGALLASVFSNGYVGDESSFNRSEYEDVKGGNISDSEIMTPSSRHSWDYNRYGSPCSTSSLSRVSYSSESSVTREAKKRLSERWAVMSSTGSCQEQQKVRRCSSTLGEMLSLTDIKKRVKCGEEDNNEGPSVCSSRSCGEDQELREPRTHLSNHVNKYEAGDHSPSNLSSLRSIPVSSTTYEKVGLNVEAPDPKVSNSVVSKESAKPKSGKSSLKGKVSSLFFSRNKKPIKEKLGPSSPVCSQVGSEPYSAELLGTSPDVKQLPVRQRSDNPEGGRNCHLEGESFNLGGPSCQASSLFSVGPKQRTCASEVSVVGPQPLENSSENNDHLSPISVLEVQFEDDVNTQQSFDIVNGDHCVLHAHRSHESESTTKSPVDLVNRTLWNGNASSETSTSFALELFAVPSMAEEEERQWISFIQLLLSAAGLEHESSDKVFARWHSPESPLDPSLLDKWMDQKEYVKQLSEAKRRQRRSNYRFLFDCVNAVLMDMMRCEFHAIPLTSDRCKWDKPGAPVTEEVWVRLREWFSHQTKWFTTDVDARLLVKREVRKEVVGRGWMEVMGLEVDGIAKEIEGKMMEELVEEVLIDFTCGLL